MKVFFGTSGNPPNFFDSKFGKDRINAPEWLHSIGLNAYEVLFTYGAKMPKERAKQLGINAKKFGIKLSVHAPYYCVFTSPDKGVVQRSHQRMKKTIELAHTMGATKIVLHPGFHNVPKALDKFIREIKKVEKWKKEKGYKVIICPETMGRPSQLGSIEEIISMCEQVPGLEPCVDFGHVHAREGGSLKSTDRYIEILESIKKQLGLKVLRSLHCHFYPVEYTEKGEKTHRAFSEKAFYPKFNHFASLIQKYNMKPTLISESKNSQDGAALAMKRSLKRSKYC